MSFFEEYGAFNKQKDFTNYSNILNANIIYSEIGKIRLFHHYI